MSPKNFKDFLTLGLCLQTGPDSYKVLIGPFALVAMEEIQASKSSTFLYKAEFWDFLKTGDSAAQNFVYKPSAAFDLDREEIIGLLQKDEAELDDFKWQAPDESGFKMQFEWSQSLFKTGAVKKTVPVICQSSHSGMSDSCKKSLLLTLLKQNSFGWTYAYFENEAGIIGHTPELLLEWHSKNKTAMTVALAGTVANVPGAKTEIETDPKIRQEHDFVIDDLQNKLKEFSGVKGQTEVLELKHLLHLKTLFSIPVESLSDFLRCAQELHPTAAMGVYPHSLPVLKDMADFDLQKSRRFFAGPLGVLSNDYALVVVPIRGLMFDGGCAKIYSGCGVTAESRYESELSELENKRNSVKKMLGLIHD